MGGVELESLLKGFPLLLIKEAPDLPSLGAGSPRGLVRPPSSAAGRGVPPHSLFQPGRPQAARGDHPRPAPLEVNIPTRRRDSGVRGRDSGVPDGNRGPRGPRLGGAARPAQSTPTRPRGRFSPFSRGTAPGRRPHGRGHMSPRPQRTAPPT